MIVPAARADLGPLSPGRRFARRLRAADVAAQRPEPVAQPKVKPPAFEPLPENERLFANVEEWS